jgi:hypothetical protein
MTAREARLRKRTYSLRDFVLFATARATLTRNQMRRGKVSLIVRGLKGYISTVTKEQFSALESTGNLLGWT